MATHTIVISEPDNHDIEVAIIDGEASKSGGMSTCRQMKHEIYDCPPVLLLVGRADDARLASWSEADGAAAPSARKSLRHVAGLNTPERLP